MSEPARPGRIRGIDVAAARQRCLKGAAAAFAVGLTVGAGLMSASADAPPDTRVTAALVQLGTHLCKGFEGLRDVRPTRKNRYTFRCNDLAVFPDVEIRLQ